MKKKYNVEIEVEVEKEGNTDLKPKVKSKDPVERLLNNMLD